MPHFFCIKILLFCRNFFLVKMCVNHAVVSWCYISNTYVINGASLSEHALIYLAQNFCGQRGQTEIDIYLIRGFQLQNRKNSWNWLALLNFMKFFDRYTKINQIHITENAPTPIVFILRAYYYLYTICFFTSANRIMLFP